MSIRKKIHKITALALAMLLLSACGAEEKAVLSGEGVRRNQNKPSIGVGRNPSEVVADPMPEVICIDPGHGFDDAGCSSDYLGQWDEADINLAIALMLDEELRSLGYQTILTHNGEEFPITSAYDNNNKFKPEERTAYAETLEIDYYVSIHCNSFEDPSVHGARIYYYDGDIKIEHTSGAIAEAINGGILTDLPVGSDSDVVEMKSGVFHVLKATTVPASLIEVGFVTNADDGANMINGEWQRAFAKGVARGIDDFYRGDATEEIET